MTRLRRSLLVALMLPGCAPEAPALERVEPSRVLNDRTERLVLTARNLDQLFEERGGALVEVPWTVEIAGRALGEVTWVSSRRLEAVLTPGLPAGTHDVWVRARDRQAVLRGGLVVVASVGPRLDAVIPDEIGEEGGLVRLVGVGFHVGTRVRVRSAEVPSTWLSDQELEVAVPPGLAGPVRLDVATPVGRASRSRLLFYVRK